MKIGFFRYDNQNWTMIIKKATLKDYKKYNHDPDSHEAKFCHYVILKCNKPDIVKESSPFLHDSYVNIDHTVMKWYKNINELVKHHFDDLLKENLV